MSKTRPIALHAHCAAEAASLDAAIVNSMDPMLISMLSRVTAAGLPGSCCSLDEMIPHVPDRWPGLCESRAATNRSDSVLFIEPFFAQLAAGQGAPAGDDDLLLSFPLAPVRDMLRHVIATSHTLAQEKQRCNAALDELDALDLAQLVTTLLTRSSANIFEIWHALKPHLAAADDRTETTTRPGE